MDRCYIKGCHRKPEISYIDDRMCWHHWEALCRTWDKKEAKKMMEDPIENHINQESSY